MTAPERLEQLHRRLLRIEDRAAILECVARHARGCDRHDEDVLTQCYHLDAVDEHGAENLIAGPDYAQWANLVHGRTSAAHMHHITTHTCEIDGDAAHAESYVLVALLSLDSASATVMSGRYLDRLERREGVWRIALRRATVELAFTANAALLASPYFTSQAYIKGTRDCEDPSYANPLTMETPATRW